jgi:hypothetical protein
MRRLCLATLLLLAACGTPQEQCIRRETAELRTLDRLIRETQGNLDRGFAYEEYTTWELESFPCLRPDGAGGTVEGTCTRRVPDIDTRPVAIDLNAERAKLASMQQKRTELARRAAAATEACRQAYPE